MLSFLLLLVFLFHALFLQNEADNVEKTDLYLALQSEIEKIPKHDVTIVMGDLNAKVGNDNVL
jgi:hypothetical protein